MDIIADRNQIRADPGRTCLPPADRIRLIHLNGVNLLPGAELLISMDRHSQSGINRKLADMPHIPCKVKPKICRISKLAILFLIVVQQSASRILAG